MISITFGNGMNASTITIRFNTLKAIFENSLSFRNPLLHELLLRHLCVCIDLHSTAKQKTTIHLPARAQLITMDNFHHSYNK